MPKTKLTPEARLAFEKARHEFCAKIYEREEERKETLEKKSDFYLSFVTVFVGALFLKLDALSTVRDLVTDSETPRSMVTGLSVALVALAISLLISLIAILESMRLRAYKTEYPTPIITSLFAPDSEYLDGSDELSLLSANARRYAVALELNIETNNRKAKWISVSAFGAFAAVIALAGFLVLVVYLSVFS